MEENRLTQVSAFFFVYVLLVLAGMFLVSLEGLYDLETNFTAVLTCISNVGPGWDMWARLRTSQATAPLPRWC